MLCLPTCRCWNLKTDRCVMALYGHSGTVNCLDVHADRLVSGAKDCQVKGIYIVRSAFYFLSKFYCHVMIKESHDEPFSNPADTF